MTDILTKPDIEVLKSLLQQVEKAKGPDRELDYILANDLGGCGAIDEPKPFTASIDSALALVKKVLPGWGFTITQTAYPRGDDYPMYSVELHDGRAGFTTDFTESPDGFVDGLHGSVALDEIPTLPLAILAALLKALIAQAEQEK